MTIQDANGEALASFVGAAGFEPLLTPLQVSKILGVHEGSVRRYIRDGTLDAIKFGSSKQSHVRVEPAALRQFIASRRQP